MSPVPQSSPESSPESSPPNTDGPRYTQNCTFSFTKQLEDMNFECESYIKMNKSFAEHLPLAAKVPRKNGVQRRVWRQFTSLAVDNSLHRLPNIALVLDI